MKKENVTVDTAIAKGHWMVNYPVLIIMLGTLGLCFYLGIEEILPFWIIPLGFVLAFGFGWLWWSIMITKWRLWAFENVRNVHELKKRAIREKLIWSDSSIFEKTEIRKASDKEKWRLLQRKFKEEDIFHDDIAVPEETIVFYSKWKNILEMLIMIICLGVGISMLVDEDYIWGSALSIASLFFAYSAFKKTKNKQPQIILNDKGIETIKAGFYPWEAIDNEEVIAKGSGKNTRHYLTYDYPKGSEHLEIDDFDTSRKDLNKLLAIYRGRSRQDNRV